MVFQTPDCTPWINQQQNCISMITKPLNITYKIRSVDEAYSQEHQKIYWVQTLVALSTEGQNAYFVRVCGCDFFHVFGCWQGKAVVGWLSVVTTNQLFTCLTCQMITDNDMALAKFLTKSCCRLTKLMEK